MQFNFSKNSNEIEKFMFGSFWRDDNCRELFVQNEKDVVLAVNKAYIDMTPRTIKGLGLSESKVSAQTKKSPAYKQLKNDKEDLLNKVKLSLARNIIAKVFITGKFDEETHQKLCKDFITDFKNIITQLNNGLLALNDKGVQLIDVNDITYGKAQKIVNMTMKYLYFFDDAHLYVNDVFNNCHMAVDEFIMKYFDGTITRTSQNWSNFDEKSYKSYQEAIKSECVKKGVKPFFAEFDYWNQGREKKDQS